MHYTLWKKKIHTFCFHWAANLFEWCVCEGKQVLFLYVRVYYMMIRSGLMVVVVVLDIEREARDEEEGRENEQGKELNWG